eukprot:CAMPEP_0175096222 /NCGR_PEP_ID=MMETSP0086_2-20121207/4609_1 /TAXON_ID=136419 /ORGANISM="Unknown Unknown, Strain D1" /LENGTH=275 /DNA_ID=CAMNT_0016369593 /DNA_START=27 /DNA_END=854 /DNA_ORIENTATION=+
MKLLALALCLTLANAQVTYGPCTATDVNFTTAQFDIIYNMLSFAIACMGSATIFFFFQFSLVHSRFRTAMVITALVTAIAFYHYFRIFNSFNEGYRSINGKVLCSGIPFNDAYRYVDWILTVPLLLTELVLVMGLPPDESVKQCLKLGLSSALMIVLGYPGEVASSDTTRWIFWALAMIPFVFIVHTLFFGLRSAVDSQGDAKGLVKTACWVTVISWCTYPFVYLFPLMGLTGAASHTAIQVGYSIADVVAKPLTGLLVWKIASLKTQKESLLAN